MPEFTEEQLTALIDQRVKAATGELEDKLAKITANRDNILKEKRQLEGRLFDRAADRLIKGEQPPPQPADRIIIRKGTPPSEYRRLKEKAQRRGIPYEVESNAAQPVAPTASKVNYVETDAHLYANKAQLAALGVGGLNAMAAQKGKRLILFKSPDDLPPEARAKHDRIVQVGDPDSFVFEG